MELGVDEASKLATRGEVHMRASQCANHKNKKIFLAA
jgi:hypothetical protein